MSAYTSGELFDQIYHSPILIVDDNEINRIFLEKTLESRGFTKLISVPSAEAALAEIRQTEVDMHGEVLYHACFWHSGWIGRSGWLGWG